MKKTTESIAKPTCSVCAEHAPPSFTDAYFDQVKPLKAPEDLKGLRLAGDGRTHQVAGIAYRYRFPRLVDCCFPDKTKHFTGCVIVTPCGLTVNIGHDCGKRCIPGFKVLEAGLEKAVDRDTWRRRLREFALDARKRMAELEALTVPIGEFQAAMSEYLPGVWNCLRRHGPGKNAIEVQLKVSEKAEELKEAVGLKVQRSETRVLLGSCVASDKFAGPFLEQLRQSMGHLVADIQRDPELAKPTGLYDRLRQLDRHAIELKRLALEAEQFFTEGNLQLLKYATEQETGVALPWVRVEGGEFVFVVAGTECRLGKFGRRRISKAG